VFSMVAIGSRLTGMEPKVVHNEKNRRYEMWVDAMLVGVLDYTLDSGERYFVHTEISPEHRGKGFAGSLIREALIDALQNSKELVVPKCSYVREYMNHNQ